MNKKTAIMLFVIIAFFGCTQPDPDQINQQGPDKTNPPFGVPTINLEDFEFEFTSIGQAGMITLMFQKDYMTKTTQRPDDVLEMESNPISEKELEELAITIEKNEFFNLPEEEFGEFVENNGPTYVMEAKHNGKEKIVSCQLNCPQEIQNIKQKVEELEQ